MATLGSEAKSEDCNVEEVRSGLDWLTITLPAEANTGDLWIEHGLWVLDQIAKQGYDIFPRTMLGYYGASAGNCFVGSREDSHMIQLTGFHANDWFNDVYRPDAHVSRIDVQVSVKYKVMPRGIVKEAYNEATASNE